MVTVTEQEIQRVLSSPVFQKRLTREVNQTISSMDRSTYNRGVQKAGSEKNFLDNVTRVVARTLVKALKTKLFLAGMGTTGMVLGASVAFPYEGEEGLKKLNEFDWENDEWTKACLGDITIDTEDISLEEVCADFQERLVGETGSGFFSWLWEKIDDVTADL